MMAPPSWEQLNEALRLWTEGRPWTEVEEAMGKPPGGPMVSAAQGGNQPASRRCAS